MEMIFNFLHHNTLVQNEIYNNFSLNVEHSVKMKKYKDAICYNYVF